MGHKHSVLSMGTALEHHLFNTFAYDIFQNCRCGGRIHNYYVCTCRLPVMIRGNHSLWMYFAHNNISEVIASWGFFAPVLHLPPWNFSELWTYTSLLLFWKPPGISKQEALTSCDFCTLWFVSLYRAPPPGGSGQKVRPPLPLLHFQHPKEFISWSFLDSAPFLYHYNYYLPARSPCTYKTQPQVLSKT